MLAVAGIDPVNTIVSRYFLTVFNPIEWVLARAVFISIILGVWIFSTGRSFKSRCIDHQFLRAVIGFAAMLLWYYAITRDSMGTTTALRYSSSLFLGIGAIISAYNKKKNLPFISLFFIVLCFLGSVLIVFDGKLLDSGDAFNLLPNFCALFCGFCSAQAILQIKHMRKWKEPVWRTSLYFCVFSAIFVLLLQIFCRDMIEPDHFKKVLWDNGRTAFCMFALVGVLGTVKHLCFTESFSARNQLLAAVLQYLAIVFASFLGMAVYHETFLPSEIAGIAFIFIASVGMSLKK